jgi:hypothetical protein
MFGWFTREDGEIVGNELKTLARRMKRADELLREPTGGGSDSRSTGPSPEPANDHFLLKVFAGIWLYLLFCGVILWLNTKYGFIHR